MLASSSSLQILFLAVQLPLSSSAVTVGFSRKYQNEKEIPRAESISKSTEFIYPPKLKEEELQLIEQSISKSTEFISPPELEEVDLQAVEQSLVSVSKTKVQEKFQSWRQLLEWGKKHITTGKRKDTLFRFSNNDPDGVLQKQILNIFDEKLKFEKIMRDFYLKLVDEEKKILSKRKKNQPRRSFKERLSNWWNRNHMQKSNDKYKLQKLLALRKKEVRFLEGRNSKVNDDNNDAAEFKRLLTHLSSETGEGYRLFEFVQSYFSVLDGAADKQIPLHDQQILYILQQIQHTKSTTVNRRLADLSTEIAKLEVKLITYDLKTKNRLGFKSNESKELESFKKWIAVSLDLEVMKRLSKEEKMLSEEEEKELKLIKIEKPQLRNLKKKLKKSAFGKLKTIIRKTISSVDDILCLKYGVCCSIEDTCQRRDGGEDAVNIKAARTQAVEMIRKLRSIQEKSSKSSKTATITPDEYLKLKLDIGEDALANTIEEMTDEKGLELMLKESLDGDVLVFKVKTHLVY